MLRARQKLGKYRILERIASGPLADVYKAFDTIHKSRVALKVPKAENNVTNEDFLREVQVAAMLQHPNILTVQNASFIDDRFVIAMELGAESLADRLLRGRHRSNESRRCARGLPDVSPARRRRSGGTAWRSCQLRATRVARATRFGRSRSLAVR